jgi:hypothetical protein
MPFSLGCTDGAARAVRHIKKGFQPVVAKAKALIMKLTI